MPMGNLATAASDLALGQNVRYVCNRFRCRWRPNYAYRPGGYYGYRPSYYGPSYAPSYYGSGPGGYGYAVGWPGGLPGGLYGGGWSRRGCGWGARHFGRRRACRPSARPRGGPCILAS